MEQAKTVRKLQIVRALVRPDQREEYLRRWAEHARRMQEVGARLWLFEDEALPGRFVEFTEYAAGTGIEAQLPESIAGAGLPGLCVRRSGADERYREVQAPDA